jgi:crotonobetainyl-CoA:carnitine CoA-transferase CaiB-like acyl-CoA transferase
VGARDRRRLVNALEGVWEGLGGDPARLVDASVEWRDPVLPSSYPIGTLAVAAVGSATLAAAQLWLTRTGARQRVRVTADNALCAFRSLELVRVDGERPGDVWSPFSGFYRTGDDRWIQLHTNFPHHLDRTLGVLGVGEDQAAVEHAIARWPGEALETALADAGACASLARTRGEWLAHPQGHAVRDLPLLFTTRRGETVRPLPSAPARPLDGVRVLDLTRVLAGPTATRTLAAHGADVLRVSSPALPEIEAALPDTTMGKRSTFLDLRDPSDRDRLRALVRDADVFVQSYRPGALDEFGFGPDALGELQPAIVAVSISAYGRVGPWSERRGYDTLVQTASGIALAEADAFGADRPRHVPVSGLDYATGYFMAAATMLALSRRHTAGGGTHVECSLVQTREWLETLGRVDGTSTRRPDDDAIVATLPTIASDWGTVTYAPPGGELSETPPSWSHGPVTPGRDAPTW